MEDNESSFFYNLYLLFNALVSAPTPMPSEINTENLDPESKAFEIQTLVGAEAEAMVESKVEKYIVSIVTTGTVPLDTLPTNPRTDETVGEEEEEGLVIINSSPSPTTWQ